ncbi:glycosyltransferase family 4 protein [Nocardia sp. BMG111209]|uniref:glycosyltransferase family 4 protein n=1 Tax=Nocardia sp. BMG111209 TaxID=1160137 RepID=UPI0003740211|nr:glycosyltransferase family 4 protein [Nocardia sp. BMG111209]
MRIALLSYRSKPHCGGQGVYVRYLSHGLAELGHEVEVFSGQPYPENLDSRVRLTEVPSLDLYREPDPFRTPRPGELRDRIDLLELATMWTSGFPEPRTFSLRAARLLRSRVADFDVVHDNQCLGSGLLDIAARLPLVATVHHPITRDRVVDLAAARWWRRPFVHRWYGFLGMQQRVARQIPELITVSSSSATDIADDFGVDARQLRVVPLGVDTGLFRPRPRLRVPGRIVAVASADKPLKGIAHLLRAVARLRGAHEIDLRLVAKLEPDGPTEKLIAELGLSDVVTVATGLSDQELAFLLSSAQIACIPSMYEGFSLPAVEAMASGAALVASRAGALPEVVGDCAVLVEPGNVEELAAAIGDLLADPGRTAELGTAGRRRALSVYSWESVAAQTVSVYEEAITRHHGHTRLRPDEHPRRAEPDDPATASGHTGTEEAQAC